MKKLIAKLKSLFSAQSSKGFTLIELIIVIAVVGVLTAVILVALDPLEQIARGEDTGRLSTIAQLGRASQAYYTAQTTYPDPAGATDWQEQLKAAGEIQNTVTINEADINCSTNIIGGVCYDTADPTIEGAVWTVLESKSQGQRAGCDPAGATPVAIVTWLSSQGKAGVTCVADAATPPAQDATLK